MAVSLILLYTGIKLDNSIFFKLLSSIENGVLIICSILFFIWYCIIYGVNYAYGEMDIKTKKENRK